MNNFIRSQLNQFINENGIMAKHVADKIGLSASAICHFRKGRRNLSKSKLRLLQDYINKKFLE